MIFRRLNLTFCSKWVKTFKNWIILQRTRVSHFSIFFFFIVNSTVIRALNERRSAFIGKNLYGKNRSEYNLSSLKRLAIWMFPFLSTVQFRWLNIQLKMSQIF